ncbi:MAG: hypothetical protein WDN04_21385 [Rhodospirillales bacterium]
MTRRLEFAFFEHRFDDEVAILEVGRVCRGRDQRQGVRRMRFVHAAGFDPLVEQLLGIGLAFFRLPDGDILQYARHAAHGIGIGDAGAHHAGTQYPYPTELCPGHVSGTAGAGLDCVQVEKKTL